MFAKEFLLKKNYELLSRIGEGTYATVYKAKRLSDSLIVAVKLINVFKMENKKIQNALNEIRIICAIDHPNVVGYHEAFLDQKNKDLYIIMEYVGGGDLNDRIRFLSRTEKHLPEVTIWRYSLQILQGLKALHQRKIIHRDIKPGNLFVSEDLETIKIGDLNVSKILRNKSMTATVVGTPYYLAPEIWKNTLYDYRCDVFSFGCVLFELTALKVPFKGNSIAELFKKIEYGKVPALPKQYSKDLLQFISASLIKNFKKRPTVEKLLQHPSLARRKNHFRDIIFSERRNSTKMLKQMRVSNLTDLSKVLPSLKNSRRNSMSMLGIGGRSFDKGFNSKKNFQNFSCVDNSKFDESYSIYSTYKNKVERAKKKLFDQKTVKAANKKKRSRKSLKLANPDKEKESKKYKARKNYLSLVKQQRKKREQKRTKPDHGATIEMEKDRANEFGSDEELIEIMDELGQTGKNNPESKIKAKVWREKKKKPKSKCVLKTRQSSKDSRGTLKTDKMIFEVDMDGKANVEANKRTTEKKTLISKREIKLYRQSKTDTGRNKRRNSPSILNHIKNKTSIDVGLPHTKKLLECLSVEQKRQATSSINLSVKESINESEKLVTEKVAKKQVAKSSVKMINSGVQSERKVGRIYQKQTTMKNLGKRVSSKKIRNSKSTQKLGENKGNCREKKITNFPLISITKPRKKNYETIEEIPEQEQGNENKRKRGANSKKSSKRNLELGGNQLAAKKAEKGLETTEKGELEKLKKSSIQTYASKFSSNKSKKNSKRGVQKVENNRNAVRKKKKETSNRTMVSSYLTRANNKKKMKNSSRRNFSKFHKTEKIKIKAKVPQISMKYIGCTIKENKNAGFNLTVDKKENTELNKTNKNLSESALLFSKISKKSKREISQKIKIADKKEFDLKKRQMPANKKQTRKYRGRPSKTRDVSRKKHNFTLYANKKAKNQSVYQKVDPWFNQGGQKGKILKKGQNKYMDLLEIKRMKQKLEKIKNVPRSNVYKGFYPKDRSKI